VEKKVHNETIPVRDGEGFNVEAVRQFLVNHVPEIPAGSTIQIGQFPTGASNLTYLIQAGEWEAVLRRPPAGPLPPKAHDMKRESAFMSHLHPYFSKVPRPIVFCEDESIMGVPFYVMERKQGVVLDVDFPPGIEYSEEAGRRISFLAADTLAELHMVDYKRAGLDTFGYPEGFVQRQVNGWIKRYERSQTDDIPAFEQISKWLVNNIPESKVATIIHNDYKLNNMLLSPDFTEVTALVDWEMSTIADPIFDLGITIAYWLGPNDSELLKSSMSTITAKPDFISRGEFVDRYVSKTGFDVSNLHFFFTFSYFKLAVIVQQIYFRWKKGQTSDQRFANYNQRVKNLMDYTLELMAKNEF
jgi:aminoglycoside phosphotransferase (APT) family kinase protein